MTAIPTRSVTMPANGLAHWIHYNSSTTQIIGSDGNNFRQRVVCWDTAGGAPSAYYSGKTTYCLIGFRLVTGSPGRFLDWHTMADDQPWGWYPPISNGGPSSQSVSPIAIDYWADFRGLHARVQPESDMGGPSHYVIFTTAQAEALRGTWIWLWLRVDWGRSDTLPDGRFRLWVAGTDDSPRIDAQNVNTHNWQQHMLSCFQGAYWSSQNNPAITVEHAAMRFGRTPQECYLDVPVYHADSVYSPPGSSTAITARQHDEADIPADLDWGGAGDTTAPTLSSAAILGTGSSLIYNEALDGAKVPLTTDYVYRVNGVSRSISTVAVIGDRVDIYLSSPVVSTDTVTVSYTRAAGREVQDIAGNLAANLVTQAVTNNTPPAVNPNRPAVTRTTAVARVSNVTARVAGLGGGGI